MRHVSVALAVAAIAVLVSMAPARGGTSLGLSAGPAFVPGAFFTAEWGVALGGHLAQRWGGPFGVRLDGTWVTTSLHSPPRAPKMPPDLYSLADSPKPTPMGREPALSLAGASLNLLVFDRAGAWGQVYFLAGGGAHRVSNGDGRDGETAWSSAYGIGISRTGDHASLSLETSAQLIWFDEGSALIVPIRLIVAF